MVKNPRTYTPGLYRGDKSNSRDVQSHVEEELMAISRHVSDMPGLTAIEERSFLANPSDVPALPRETLAYEARIILSMYIPSVIDWGADPTGVADSTAAIQAAWDEAGLIYIPQGVYKVSSALVSPDPNNLDFIGIIGDGAPAISEVDGTPYGGRGTLLRATHTTGNVITVQPNFRNRFQGFGITRTSQATSGIGIEFEESFVTTLNYIDDVVSRNSNHGIYLRDCGPCSFATRLVAMNNRSQGISIGSLWDVSACYCEGNGGDAFVIESPNFPGTVGTHTRLKAFDNGGYGLNCKSSSSGTRVEGLRLSDSYFYQNAAGEIRLDSRAQALPHMFTNCYIDGSYVTGAHAVTITGNNYHVHFTGCEIYSTTTGYGINCTGAASLIVSGCNIEGFGSTANNGIYNNTAGSKVSVMGSRVLNFTNNINLQNITAATIHGCNAGGGILTAGTGTVSNVGNY